MQTKAVLKHTSGNHLSTTAYAVVQLLHGPCFTCLSVPAKEGPVPNLNPEDEDHQTWECLLQQGLHPGNSVPEKPSDPSMSTFEKHSSKNDSSIYLTGTICVSMVLLSRQTNLQLFDLCSGAVLSNFILFSWFFKTFYYSYLVCAHAYMCMHRCNVCVCSHAHMHTPWASMCRSELVLSFYHLTPGGPAQIIKLSG